MQITTEMIKKLRESTGVGILDCRTALENADGDMEKAMDLLREKGLATASKRAGREAFEGVVELAHAETLDDAGNLRKPQAMGDIRIDFHGA